MAKLRSLLFSLSLFTVASCSAGMESATMTTERSRQIVIGSDPYVAVEVILTNLGEVPLPLLPTRFVVGTSDGHQYYGDAHTATYPTGCDTQKSLSVDQSATCTVLFRVPLTKTADTLSYTLPSASRMSVGLSTTPCTICGASSCVDLNTDPGNCGACGRGGDSLTVACVNGAPRCAKGESCTISSTTPNSCDELCGSQQCTQGSSSYGTIGCGVSEETVDCKSVPAPNMVLVDCDVSFRSIRCFCTPVAPRSG